MSVGDDQEFVDNVVDQYRREHSDPADQVAGDLMPSLLETTNAYQRTATGLGKLFAVPLPPQQTQGQTARILIRRASLVLLALSVATVLLILAANKPLGALGWIAVALMVVSVAVLTAGILQLRRERRRASDTRPF